MASSSRQTRTDLLNNAAVGLKMSKKPHDRSLEYFKAAYHQLHSCMRQEHLEYLSSN